MKCYDVVGYVIESSVFCSDCAKKGDPIFAGSEWDCAPMCENCGEVLDVNCVK